MLDLNLDEYLIKLIYGFYYVFINKFSEIEIYLFLLKNREKAAQFFFVRDE
jgi:hypothetical protein